MTDLSFPKDIPTPAGFYIIFLLILIIPYPFLKYNPYFTPKKQKECKSIMEQASSFSFRFLILILRNISELDLTLLFIAGNSVFQDILNFTSMIIPISPVSGSARISAYPSPISRLEEIAHHQTLNLPFSLSIGRFFYKPFHSAIAAGVDPIIIFRLCMRFASDPVAMVQHIPRTIPLKNNLCACLVSMSV